MRLIISDGIAGARLGTQDVNLQTGCSPKGLTPCVNQSSLLSNKAAKGAAARSGLTGPQTPEIVQDRGRSPSTDSVPSPAHQQVANCSSGKESLPHLDRESSSIPPHCHCLSCHIPCDACRARDSVITSHLRDVHGTKPFLSVVLQVQETC